MQVHPLFSSFFCPSVPVRGDQTFVVLKVIFISIIKVLRLFCAVGYDFKDALDIIVSQNMVTITSILLQLFFFLLFVSPHMKFRWNSAHVVSAETIPERVRNFRRKSTMKCGIIAGWLRWIYANVFLGCSQTETYSVRFDVCSSR